MEAGRELDALIQSEVFKCAIQMRACNIDPETGHWGEVQSLHEPYEIAGVVRDDDDFTRGQLADVMERARTNHYGGIQYGMQPCFQDGHRFWEVVPFYSDSIAAAWQVVDSPALQKFAFFLSFEGELWNCNLVHGMRGMDSHIDVSEDATTVPLVICLAALKAVGEELPAPIHPAAAQA